MEPCKTQVWIIPEKKLIEVDDHIGGVPVGVCNLDAINTKIVHDMGGHKEFDYWEEAVAYASDLSRKHGWTYEMYSMMDDCDDEEDDRDEEQEEDYEEEEDIGEFHPKDWS